MLIVGPVVQDLEGQVLKQRCGLVASLDQIERLLVLLEHGVEL